MSSSLRLLRDRDFLRLFLGQSASNIGDQLVFVAQALTSTTANLAILAGPALGAVIVVTIGAGWAFAVDSLTFVLSAALLVGLAPRPRGRAAQRRSLATELRAGWDEVRARSWVWATIGAFTGAVLCAYAPWLTLAPSVAAAHYGGAAVFGMLESVSGGGALLGAVIAMSWRPRRPIAIGIALVLLWPAQSLAFAGLAPIVAVGALAFAAGFAFAVFEVWWQTALARRIPAHALSRVSSFDWMGSLALMPLGFALSGPVAAALGARTVLAVGAGVTVVLLLMALVPAATEVTGEAVREGGVAQPSSSATRSR